MRAILQRYDGLRERIAEDGDLRRFVNVYVGGEDRDEVTDPPGGRGRGLSSSSGLRSR